MRTFVTQSIIKLGIVGFLIFMASLANASQQVRVVNGREVVVHTNPLPVVMHRLVPPQHGRHVTVRELKEGKVPSSGRFIGTRRK